MLKEVKVGILVLIYKNLLYKSEKNNSKKG
jgi:hypothetical protein